MKKTSTRSILKKIFKKNPLNKINKKAAIKTKPKTKKKTIKKMF